MFIFIGSTKVIPEKMLVSVSMSDKNIYIEYYNGEYVYAENESTQSVPKVVLTTVRYPDEESALWEMRKFYLACDKKANVYCFSPDKGVELS